MKKIIIFVMAATLIFAGVAYGAAKSNKAAKPPVASKIDLKKEQLIKLRGENKEKTALLRIVANGVSMSSLQTTERFYEKIKDKLDILGQDKMYEIFSLSNITPQTSDDAAYLLKIGEQLGVKKIIGGNIRQEDNVIVVTIKTIDFPSKEEKTYRKKIKNIKDLDFPFWVMAHKIADIPIEGTLSIKSAPSEADIWMGRKLLGRTSLEKKITLPEEKTLDIKVIKAGYEVTKTSLTVSEDKLFYNLDIALKEKPTKQLSNEEIKQIWSLCETPVKTQLNTIFALNKDSLWAAGEKGIILHSTDSGKTWQKYELPCKINPQRLIFWDPACGWMVGSEGKIFRYLRVPTTQGVFNKVTAVQKLVDENKLEEAENAIFEAFEEDSFYYQVYCVMGTIFEKNNKKKEALESYLRFVYLKYTDDQIQDVKKKIVLLHKEVLSEIKENI